MASSIKMLGVGMAVMLLVLKPEIGVFEGLKNEKLLKNEKFQNIEKFRPKT